MASEGKTIKMLQLHIVWLHMEGPLGWQVEMVDTIVQEDKEQMGVKKVATPRNLKAGGKVVPSPEELGHRNIEDRVEIEIVGMSRT